MSLKAENLFFLDFEELMEIKIASHVSEDELTVGSTVSKVTEAQWQNQGAEKTFDALAHLPGVYVSEYFHGQMVPSFRGFTGPEQYNSFLLLLDGIPLNSYSSAAGTYGTPNYALGNLRNIEVIRGPGSSIYGADAFNGVVSLNTWSSDVDRQEAWVEGGMFGYRQATARVRQSLGDEATITSIISASGVDDEELPDPFHPSPGAPITNAQISAEYENITTTHKIAVKDVELALYYSQHDVEDAFGAGELAGVFPNGHHTDGSAKMMAVKLSHSLELDHGIDLASSVHHVQDELFGSFGLANVAGPPVAPTLDWDSKDMRTGANLLARKSLDDFGTRMMLGYDYSEVEVEHLGISVSGSEAPWVAKNKRRTVHGVMGQLEQRFLEEKFQIIAGARIDDYSDFGTHTSPRLAAIFHPTEKSALKLLYGNAYRAPSVNEQSDNGVVKGGGSGLDPEVVDTYELAWIHAGDDWRYRFSMYRSEVEDSIALGASSDPAFSREYLNTAEAESYGVELDAIYQADAWQLYANAAWNRSKQMAPVSDPDAYSAYPDVAASAGVTYHLNQTTSFSMHNLVYDGFKSTARDPLIGPSYVDRGQLPTLWRTDVHLSWTPPRLGACKMYVTLLDVFDRQDVAASMSSVEYGNGTPGRKLVAGVHVTF